MVGGGWLVVGGGWWCAVVCGGGWWVVVMAGIAYDGGGWSPPLSLFDSGIEEYHYYSIVAK